MVVGVHLIVHGNSWPKHANSYVGAALVPCAVALAVVTVLASELDAAPTAPVAP